MRRVVMQRRHGAIGTVLLAFPLFDTINQSINQAGTQMKEARPTTTKTTKGKQTIQER